MTDLCRLIFWTPEQLPGVCPNSFHSPGVWLRQFRDWLLCRRAAAAGSLTPIFISLHSFSNSAAPRADHGRLASAPRTDGIVSNADRWSRRSWSHRPGLRSCAGPARIIVHALGVACHFQTSQQVDIARETPDCRLGRAGLPVRTGILRPRLLELPKCGTFVARAAGHIDSRSTLKTALPPGVELRHRVKEGNGRKGRPDSDRHMKPHVDLLSSCFWPCPSP